MKTWVKVYTEINRDPDIGTLSWAQRGIWQALLALCGEIDDRDEDGAETGRMDTIDRVAWSIRCDMCELEEAIAAFEDRGMVERDGDDVLWLPNYPKRQGRPLSSRPAAIAERVKRYRAKVQPDANEAPVACNEDVTTLQRGVTPPDPDTDTEIDPKTTPDGVAASQPPPRQRKARAAPSSNGSEHKAIFDELLQFLRLDPNLIVAADRGRLNALSKRIRDGGYTLAQVQDARGAWYSSDWRGKKGDPPANDRQLLAALSKQKEARAGPQIAASGPYKELEPWQ